jgi:hypothetical protein
MSAIAVLLMNSARADEGMWLLPLIEKLNIDKMHEMGFKLSAEDIYGINNSSIKDAVVIFGGGCTGELISDKGLILTNHHCGYGEIQALSTMEHNYLEDGFWAATLDDELPAPGLAVTFMKRMEEVTDKILEGVTDAMSFDDRNKKILENRTAIIKEAQEGNSYKISVYSFFEGNRYFMVVYEVFNDVRFVGAPPSSIGKFGYDTDNWMWPRHTGDFSMFRVYADANGKPAEYSPSNVPYKPAHHLPISLKGYEKEDFAMTIGYPGSTNRYLTSWGIEERTDIQNHALIKVRGAKQEIWSEAMNADEKIKLQYASKYARSSNYWKNSIGMNRGIAALNVLEKKRAIEKDFAERTKNNAEYADVLQKLANGYAKRAGSFHASIFLRETLWGGTEILQFSQNATELEKAIEAGVQQKIDEAVKALRETATQFFKDYSASTDQKVLAAMLRLYAGEVSTEYLPEVYANISKKYKNDYAKYASYVFAKSMFASENALNAFLAKPSLKKLQADPAFTAGKTILAKSKQLSEAGAAPMMEIATGNRLFLKGLMETHPEKVYYSDANFTMRASYGKVGNYEPRDAVVYEHFTTLKGVMEKEDADNFEFIVPAKLKELYATKNYGRYAANDGEIHVCFTSNNDITGGNSGSPVINARGELFGLAFDGNWEAMSGDIAFEPELQKCINVDIRYVLFIIDKYAGATNLINEMTIVE